LLVDLGRGGTHQFTCRGHFDGVVSRETRKRSRSWCNDWFGAVRDAVMLPAYGVTNACRGPL